MGRNVSMKQMSKQVNVKGNGCSLVNAEVSFYKQSKKDFGLTIFHGGKKLWSLTTTCQLCIQTDS